MRTPSRLAVATLTVALALVALPGLAASRGPADLPGPQAEAFRRITVPGTLLVPPPAVTPDPGGRSAAALGPTSSLADRFAASSIDRSRPTAAAPAAPVRVTVRPTPTPRPAPRTAVQSGSGSGSASSTSGSWRYDPEVSWYGPGLYGNRTACGQTLTTSLRGVAHRSLPCGTRVEFRNPANGRTVTVPVVDRGPYVEDRHWDLTSAACSAIDHCYTGPLQWRFP